VIFCRGAQLPRVATQSVNHFEDPVPCALLGLPLQLYFFLSAPGSLVHDDETEDTMMIHEGGQWVLHEREDEAGASPLRCGRTVSAAEHQRGKGISL